MTNNEKSDIHSGIAWAIIFSLSAIIMSIVALATCNPRTDLSIDYMGVIVGILALLVTALVGWQVFSLIKIERLRENLENAEKKADSIRQELTQQINRHIAQSSMVSVTHFANHLDKNKTDTTTLTLMYGLALQALYSQLEANSSKYTNSCITALVACLVCANENNRWDKIFDKKTIEAADKTYKLMLSQAKLFTTEQIDNLMLIHKCRTEKTIDAALLAIISK